MTTIFKKLSTDKRTLIVNYASLSLVQIAGFILPLISLAYLVRVIGPEKFGIVAFAQAVVIYFGLITDFGTNLYAPREIAVCHGDHERISILFSNILFIKFLALLIAITAYIIVIYTVPKFKAEIVLFIYTGGYMIVTALLPTWFFQGIQKMASIAVANLLSRLLGLIFMFAIIQQASDYIYAPVTNVLGQAIGLCIMYYIIIFKEKFKIIRPDINLVKKIAHDSLPLMISTISINIYTGINTVILGFLTNNTIVGYYSAAENVVKAGMSLQSQLGTVFYPHISQLAIKSREHAFVVIRKAFVITMLFAIPSTIFIFINSDSIIYLVFGSEFSLSVIPLKALSLLFIIIGLSNVFGLEILLPFGEKNLLMKPVLIASIISPILNFILVPYLEQYGATLAFLVSETWITLYMYFEIKKFNILLLSQQVLLRLIILIACLPIATIVFSKYAEFNVICNAIAYVILYGILLILLGLVNVKDRTVLS